MPIAVSCKCGKRFAAKDHFAGKKARCPNCQAVLLIPGAIVQPTPLEPQSVLPPDAEPISEPSFESSDPLAMDLGNLAELSAPYSPPAFQTAPAALAPAKPTATATKAKGNQVLLIGLSVGGGVLILLVVVACVVIYSLRWRAAPTAAGSIATGPTPANRLGLTEEECLAAATRFAAAITAGDIASTRGFIDVDEMIRAATAGIEAPESAKQDFIRGFKNTGSVANLAQKMATVVQQGGIYRALRAHRHGDETRVWMCLIGEGESFTYQDLVFFRGLDGQLHVADIYSMTSGELLSQTLRRGYMAAAAAENPTLWQRLTGSESDFAKHLPDFQAMAAQFETQPASALAIYRRLPDSLKKDKTILLFRIVAAISVGEQEYLNAIGDFRSFYPDDPAVDLLSIEFHRLRGEFDQALASVDGVDRAVGGDPLLNTWRTGILLEKGDFDAARRAANAMFSPDSPLVTPGSAAIQLQYGQPSMREITELPAMTVVEPGIEKAIVRLFIPPGAPGQANTIYVYRPAGNHEPNSMPCVFVAAAGGTDFSGLGIAEADEPEFLPYVRAGFVVVGYETDGEWIDESIEAFRTGFQRYQASQAGLVNANNAVEFTLAKLPEVDSNRLYTAGHSSAGKQAFLLAAHDSRMKGCISFNGVLDVEESLVDQVGLFVYLPAGSRDFVLASSPRACEHRINCPILLFHTEDDSVIPVHHATECAERLRKLGKQVTLVTPPGDHYDPMIEQGLPLAVQWLVELDSK